MLTPFRILFMLLLSASAAFAAKAPMNIVFILADDQRNDMLGVSGHPVIRTPAIDKLAAEGVRFDNAFVTTPICGASRASILSGLYERTHGHTFGRAAVSREFTLGSYGAQLRKAGYRTGYVGKKHAMFTGEEQGYGDMFDLYQPVSMRNYWVKQEDGTMRHETELCLEHAERFIREAVSDKVPFALSLCFFANHAVDRQHEIGKHFAPLPEWKHEYDEDAVPAPRLGAQKYFEALPPFLQDEKTNGRRRFGWRWDTEEKYTAHMRDLYGVVSGIDAGVAQMRRVLEETGQSDNTLIIYSADNGYMLGDRGLAGKWNHYDESLRVPFIVFDPNLESQKRGAVRSEFILNIDIAPTILDYAGIELPKHYQGMSVRELVDGKQPQWRDDFYCEHLYANESIPWWRGVRGKDFSYAVYFGKDDYECLYDLRKDPDQVTNVAADPNYKEALDRMRQRLLFYKKTVVERPNEWTVQREADPAAANR